MDAVGDGVFFIQSTIADDFMASTDAAILWVFKQIHSKELLLSYVRRSHHKHSNANANMLYEALDEPGF